MIQNIPYAKHEAITKAVRRSIEAGVYHPGDKIDTEMSMSQQYGVSRNTVREALMSLVQEGLLYRIQGKGTFVSPGAQEGRGAAGSRHVGVVFHNIFSLSGNEYICRILNGAQDCSEMEGYNFTIFTIERDLDSSNNHLLWSSVDSGLVAGLLILSPMVDRDLIRLKEAGCPFVVVGNTYLNVDVPTVNKDDYGVGYKAVRAMVEDGHSKILVTVSQWSPHSNSYVKGVERMIRGYEHAVADCGLDYKNVIMQQRCRTDDNDIGDMLPELDRALSEGVTVILTNGTPISGQVCDYLRSKGKRIGEDIQVYVFNDSTAIPDTINIPQPLQAEGKLAAQKLFDQIHKRPFAVNEVVPVEW